MKLNYQWLQRELRSEPFDDGTKRLLDETIGINFFPPDMPVVHQGAVGDSVYFLYSGSVKVEREEEHHDGGGTVLASGPQVHVFGEMSFFTGEPASADVIAGQECVIYEIRRDDFRKIMERDTTLAMQFMTLIVRHMADIIRRMDNRLCRLY